MHLEILCIVALHKLCCEASRLGLSVCTETRPKSCQIDRASPYLQNCPKSFNMMILVTLRPQILAKYHLFQSKISN